MREIDLEKERFDLDREMTFLHFRKAEKIIRRCLEKAEKEKNCFFIYYFTAQKYILKEVFKKAVENLDNALNLRPSDGITYNDKAVCLAEMEDYESSLLCFNEGIKRDRDCASLYHNKGWLLNLLGRYKPAIICFHKALELHPDRPESLYSLGDSYYHLGELKKTRIYFKKAARAIKGKSSYFYKETLRRLKT
ncbi:MAG: tetratricopeptide repeat protein [Candidatus Omnitrophica bacterium]|nr:tetratricopeptide repeat protein [Candidatus Omnitrophota bacterium]